MHLLAVHANARLQNPAPLWYAYRHPRVVELLIQAGADVNVAGEVSSGPGSWTGLGALCCWGRPANTLWAR